MLPTISSCLLVMIVTSWPRVTVEALQGKLPGRTQSVGECLAACANTTHCRAANFETGLCILFNSSASSVHALQASHFPVFTIYAQMVCLTPQSAGSCSRTWSFERVPMYELRRFVKKRIQLDDRIQCMEACLLETNFKCRSFNYNYKRNECVLSEMDRHTISSPGSNGSRYFQLATSDVDYFESNCVEEPLKLCSFKPITGRVLKTVDSVYQDITTVEDCRAKCLASQYRCLSFDLGDPSNLVCRTSHLDSSSLSHIENAYFDIKQAVTYELASCYNVTVDCSAKSMTTKVITNRLFNGKFYAKRTPNSCVSDVQSALAFSLSMSFEELGCDLLKSKDGAYSTDLIIQHHDSVVTQRDLGLSVQCLYALGNRTISTGPLTFDENNREGIGSLYEDGKDSYPLHEVTVAAPNVSMLITDQFGGDISAARVGDPLSLRIVITDGNSPYQLFLRQLVAFDTIDESEIVLVDDHGCPTDPAIMGAVERGFGKDRSLSTSFDAFKFPNSENVRFRALVSPCVGSCEPVHCYAQGSDGTHQQTYSYGRRRRSANNLTRSMEDLMVTRNLQVLDTFPFDSEDNPNSVERTSRLLPFCGKSLSYVLSGVMLLLGQIVIFAVWTSAIIRNRRRQSAMQSSFDNSCFDNRSDSSLNFCTSPSLLPSLPISIYNHHRC